MIHPGERHWLLLVVLIVLVVTTLPYLFAYQQQTEAWRFSGFVFGVDDGNTYIAKMLRSSSGDWLFRTPYTAYAQKGFLAFLPYYLLGKLASPPALHDQLVNLFQIFRLVSGFLMIWTTYAFVAYFIDGTRLRRVATLVAILGGGLGFLQVFGLNLLWDGRTPLEFYSPETFGFLSIFGLPHLALARSLLLLGFLFMLKAMDVRSIKLAILSGLMWLLLGLVQPLNVVTAWVVLGAYLLLRIVTDWKRNREHLVFTFRAAIVAILISSPMVAYNFFEFMLDPVLKGWGEQNRIFSPPPGDYLLAFGLLLPLAGIGGWQVLKAREKNLILLGWVLVFPVLAYLPYNLQRRLPEGIWVALVILAVMGFQRLGGYWKKAGIVFLSLSFLSTALVCSGAFFAVAHPAAPLYQPGDVIDAYQFIDQAAEKDDVVLASFEISNGLPAHVPVRTITGHGPESINADQVAPRIRAFFLASTLDEERIRLLEEFNVRFYIHTPGQDALMWRPDEAPYLTLEYANLNIQVYSVNLPAQ